MKMVARLCVQVLSVPGKCATSGKIRISDRFCGKNLTNEIDPAHFEKHRTWNAGKCSTVHQPFFPRHSAFRCFFPPQRGVNQGLN